MADAPTEPEIKEEEVVPETTPPEASEPKLAEPKALPTEPVEEPEEETPEEVETPPEEEDPQLSRRAAKRAGDLKFKQLLSRQTQPPPQPQAPSQDPLDYAQAFDIQDPTVIKQLEDDRTAAAQAQYQAGVDSTRAEIRTSEWRTLLNFDAPQTEAKYGWLNPKDSENFDPAMADAVNAEYKSVVGYDEQTGLVSRPDIRYSDFIEARVELSTRLAKAMTENTAKNVAKQSAQTGLRPDGSSAKRLNLNQAPEDMSLEELYAKIGQTPPKKS